MVEEHSDDVPPAAESAEQRDPAAAPPTVRSDDLLRGGREILIEHAREVYRLRITRNGKLILTK
ncbi:MAG: hemin uptake protein HemP [Planctomycetia bacterium]|nr:hemin uptake protein HemP [Planctomycetia bacterium]